MRIVFKIIAIIGVLSFLGGLKNGVFFFFGLILAGIFGYFGWRPEKKMEQEHSPSPTQPPKKTAPASNRVNSITKYTTIKQEIKSENELSESELERQIESNNQKKELLFRSYNDGLFNSQEYDHKNSELEAEISKLNKLLTLKLTSKRVILENKNLFDRLLELKSQGLINPDEYKFKYNELLSSLLRKIESQNEDAEKERPQEFNDSNNTVNQEKANKDSRKTYYLLGISLIIVVPVAILIFQYLSNKSYLNSSDNIANEQVNYSNSDDKITDENIVQKDTLEGNKIEINESNNIVESDFNNPLDRIYLGTNLFHEGSGGTWGRATISKQGNHYWIKGEHKMSNGDWIKIEGKILNPTIEGFTFNGKITAYSPSSAESVNKYEFLRKDKDRVYGDTCIWIGETAAYKLFENRKYWRIKTHDCYHYTTDIDIFHN